MTTLKSAEISKKYLTISAAAAGTIVAIISLTLPILDNIRQRDKLSSFHNENIGLACFGQFAQNCPQKYDDFFDCDSGDENGIGRKMCNSNSFTVKRIFTMSGNKCGYAIFAVKCNK